MSGVEVREGLAQTCSWADELLLLAERAERLARREPDLQEQVELAQEWLRYGFLACTPSWIARTCRLSARLLVPVLANPEPLDAQADSIWRLRERVRGQAKQLELEQGEAPELPPDPLDLEVEEELVPLELEEAPLAPVMAPAPVQQLRPRAERMRTEPIPLTEEEVQEREERERARQERLAARMPVAATTSRPRPAAPRREGGEERREPPAHLAGWLTPPAVAEKLGVSRGLVTKWIRQRRLPAEQVVCLNGHHYFLHPDVQKPGRQATTRAQGPEGWLQPDELAARLGVSRGTISNWINRGVIAAHQVERIGWKWWIDPSFEPPPKPEPTRERNTLPPVPAGWTRAVEAAELLDVPLTTLGSWRKRGRLGAEGVGWCWRGRKETLIADAVIERLEQEEQQAAGKALDQLLQEIAA